ncbi:MAG: tetratricopeptide repeat protein [Candidatus Omnitrophica bacterium]|nr:tetratricopeptide repeat protein [Candidatus Omnitrophota bacterium]
MKKACLIYLIILAGLYAVLSLFDLKGDYIVEKKIWKLYQMQLDIAKDPRVIPDLTFKNVIDGYRKVIEQYRGSRLTPTLYIRLGEVYSLKKDYEQARKTFHETIKRYPDNHDLSAQAMFEIGKTYELEQNWIEASRVYNAIIREYSETETAMSVPIYIANYYRNQNDSQMTKEAYEVARRYYKKMAADYTDTKVGLNALRYLSNCYLEQKGWNHAVETLGTIIEKYAQYGYLPIDDMEKMIKTINIISAYKIKNYDKAILLYQGIIDRNPNHRFRGYLQKMIDAFQQLKKEDLKASNLE